MIITEKIELEIIKDYLENKMTKLQIQSKYGIYQRKLDSIFLKHKIKSRKPNDLRFITYDENTENIILEYYNKYQNINLIVKKFKLSRFAVIRVLVKNNVVIEWKRTNPTQFVEIWTELYGKDIAEQMYKDYCNKISKTSSGKGNGMFGKPSPKGAGNGWKGWYKSFYFRSLREVCYVFYLEENGITYISAELKRLTIPYIFNNKERTYRPDFLINGNELIEIKPKRLHETPNIIAKKLAAEKFCRERKWKYTLIDFDIDTEKIYHKYKIGELRFDDRYEEKFLEYCNN